MCDQTNVIFFVLAGVVTIPSFTLPKGSRSFRGNDVCNLQADDGLTFVSIPKIKISTSTEFAKS